MCRTPLRHQPLVAALSLGMIASLVTTAPATPHFLRQLGLQAPQESVDAPDFTLKDVTGRKVQLADFKGKVVFLNFFATWCGPCRIEMPGMERLFQSYREKGLVVLAVDLRESAKTVRAFTQELKVSFPTLLDEDGSVAFMYGVRPLPTTYLIGRDGKILWRAFSSREWDNTDVRRYLAQLLAGENRLVGISNVECRMSNWGEGYAWG